MDLPKKIKVGHMHYDLVSWSELEADAKDCWGRHSPKQQILNYREDLKLRTKAEVILHEVIHAVCEHWDREENANEEATVRKITNGLAAVWVDNPQLIAWFNYAFTEPSDAQI